MLWSDMDFLTAEKQECQVGEEIKKNIILQIELSL